jgi:hypothetical protein
VAAKQAKEGPATNIIRVNGTGKIVVVTGEREEETSAADDYKPLAALGIHLTDSGHDLWSRDGMTRSLDPLTDQDLVRAIHASPPLRLAALRILLQRIHQPFNRGCGLTHATVLKQTGPTVLQAVLNERALSEADSELRLETMRGLAAIRPPTSLPQLAEQLLFGLDQTIEDFRPPADLERQRRMEALIGKEAAAVSEGQKTFRDLRHFEVAAGLAVLAGKDVTEALAVRLEDYLKDRILRYPGEQPCTDELVANASYGADVIMALIRKVDTEAYAIPNVQLRIQNMAAIAAQNSVPLKAMLDERCASGGRFMPDGEPSQAWAFCRASAK